MINNELKQENILEDIKKTFSETIATSELVNYCLENRTLEKLPINMTIGNHEVYKICYQGNATSEPTEDGILFLFPGSGIIKHSHPASQGISETYTAIGKYKFHWQKKEYLSKECQLDNSHGIDIENTPRIIQYIKENKLLKEKTSSLIKKKKR